MAPWQAPTKAPSKAPTMAPTSAPLPYNRVVSFHWWNADSDSYLQQLNSGDVFCKKTYKLNIQAITLRPTPVTLQLSGELNETAYERNSPYFLLRNSQNATHIFVNGKNFKVGEYTLFAYPGNNSTTLGRLTVNFKVVNCP
jgi:hypothetical protein